MARFKSGELILAQDKSIDFDGNKHRFQVEAIQATASSTLSPGTLTKYITLTSNSGEVELNATTQIADGSDGDEITIIGTSDTNYVKLVDGGNLRLRSPEILLKAEKSITLLWLDALSDWTQIGSNVAVSNY